MAFFTPNQTPNLTHTWTEDDVEIASTAAIHFVKAFYKSMDNVVERLPLLGRFYTDRSTLIWNGTKATGLMEIGDLLKDVPPSHNEILSVDCHPIAGTPFPRLLVTVQGSATHLPPATLSAAPLTTKLAKAYYTPVNDAHQYPDIPDAVRPEEVSDHPVRQGQSRDRRARGESPTTTTSSSTNNKAAPLSQKDKEDLLPRMFHEVFVLANTEEVPAPNAEGVVLPPTGSQQPQYVILSDTFRFVG
ncbi:hypothetical protein NCC49_004158 [Naganishia albida]|nr:hypothetical protein NCC49_004158 [Naganishia albida]